MDVHGHEDEKVDDRTKAQGPGRHHLKTKLYVELRAGEVASLPSGNENSLYEIEVLNATISITDNHQVELSGTMGSGRMTTAAPEYELVSKAELEGYKDALRKTVEEAKQFNTSLRQIISPADYFNALVKISERAHDALAFRVKQRGPIASRTEIDVEQITRQRPAKPRGDII